MQFFQYFRQISQQLSKDPKLGVHFRFADESSFQCSLCAQCCRHWEITIPQNYYENWGAQLIAYYQSPLETWFELLPQGNAQHYAKLKKHSGTPDCIMLRPDQQCQLHHDLGPEAKPPACQAYPRQLLQRSGSQIAASQMMPSCSSVGRQPMKPWPLQHRFAPLPQAATAQVFQWNSRQFLTEPTHILWQGLSLDLLERSEHFGEWLGWMQLCFQSLAQKNQTEIDQALLEALAYHTNTLSLPSLRLISPQSPPHLEDVLRTLEFHPDFQVYTHCLTQILKGKTLLPELPPSHLILLRNTQRFFLQRQILTQPHLTKGLVNALQQTFTWAVFERLVAILARVQAHLTPEAPPREQLGAVTNLVFARLAQTHQNVKYWGFDTLSDSECLLQIQQIRQWNIF